MSIATRVVLKLPGVAGRICAVTGRATSSPLPSGNLLWWEEFGDGKDLLLLTIKADDTVIALCPLYRKLEDGKTILRLVGGIDLTDYLGPDPQSGGQGGGSGRSGSGWPGSTDVEWDEFDAHKMPVSFGFTEFLVERADHAGFGFALQQEETAAILRLPSSWDDYLWSPWSSATASTRNGSGAGIEREHPDTKLRASTAPSKPSPAISRFSSTCTEGPRK